MKLIVNGVEVTVSGGMEGIPTIPLTQAEYDALTDDEKNAEKLYLITDDVSTGAGGSAGEIYSEEETVIGAWIDGKPLYRKVIEFPKSSVTNNAQLSLTSYIPDLDEVVMSHGYLVDKNIDGNGANRICPVPAVDLPDAWFRYEVDRVNGVSISRSGSIFTGYPFRIVLEYTKTTDEATT